MLYAWLTDLTGWALTDCPVLSCPARLWVWHGQGMEWMHGTLLPRCEAVSVATSVRNSEWRYESVRAR